MSDEKMVSTAAPDPIAGTLAFFASCIRSGEKWDATCQQAYDRATKELKRAYDSNDSQLRQTSDSRATFMQRISELEKELVQERDEGDRLAWELNRAQQDLKDLNEACESIAASEASSDTLSAENSRIRLELSQEKSAMQEVQLTLQTVIVDKEVYERKSEELAAENSMLRSAINEALTECSEMDFDCDNGDTNEGSMRMAMIPSRLKGLVSALREALTTPPSTYLASKLKETALKAAEAMKAELNEELKGKQVSLAAWKRFENVKAASVVDGLKLFDKEG